jgi:hypothetical protein
MNQSTTPPQIDVSLTNLRAVERDRAPGTEPVAVEDYLPIVQVPTMAEVLEVYREDVPGATEFEWRETRATGELVHVAMIPAYHISEAYIRKIGDAFRYETTFAEESAVFRRFGAENDVHYYSAPREDFFIFEAIDEAAKAGKSAVVLDNMS